MASVGPTTDAPVISYTPESQLRSPMRLVRAMGRDLLASRELAWRLAVRDVSARYRQAGLGLLWAFLPPVATAMVFVFLNSQGVINIGAVDVPYPAFVTIGTVLWQLFVDSLHAPLKVMASSRSMLVKANFPREALILSGMIQVGFDVGIRMSIVVAVFVAFQIPLTWTILLAPFGMLVLLILGITIGLFLVPIGVLYTDISLGMATILSLWFYATPVVYPPPQHGVYALLINLNPVGPVLVGTRDLLMRGTLSDPWPFFIVSGLALLGSLLGWVFYRLSLPILAERLGS